MKILIDVRGSGVKIKRCSQVEICVGGSWCSTRLEGGDYGCA